MRLFVALWPPEPVLDQLESHIDNVRAEYADLAWTDRTRAHITLVFLGSVSNEAVDPLAERLQAVCDATDPFWLRLAGTGNFGRATLWAGVDGDTPALSRLHRTTVAAMGDWAAPRRAWSAHLTLARGRRHGDVRPAARVLDGLTTDAWEVTQASLVHSDTRPDGAVYHQLRSMPLRGGPT